MSDIRGDVAESLMYAFTEQIFPDPLTAPKGGFWDRDIQADPILYPAVVFDVEDDTDGTELNIGTPQESRVVRIAIRVISEVSSAEASSILKVIHSHLDGKVLTVDGWNSFNMERVRQTPPVSDSRGGGGFFHNLGMLYELYLEKEEV